MKKCWDPDPKVRPSFEEIITSLDEILIECCIQDSLARKFWKDHFLTPGQVFYPSGIYCNSSNP